MTTLLAAWLNLAGVQHVPAAAGREPAARSCRDARGVPAPLLPNEHPIQIVVPEEPRVIAGPVRPRFQRSAVR